MITDFFKKRENIFITIIALISILFVITGYIFLFFDTKTKNGPKIIPNTVEEIVWKDFSSKVLGTKISYPNHFSVFEQKELNGVGITISEFESKSFVSYFSNQNHFSIYPEGIDNQFFYGKTKTSNFVSEDGREFSRTEYLTVDNKVWAIMLVPKEKPENWQNRGFIWIQSALRNKFSLCVSSKGVLIDNVECDPYSGELPIFRGEVSDQFINFSYEIINRNKFEK